MGLGETFGFVLGLTVGEGATIFGLGITFGATGVLTSSTEDGEAP